MIERIPSDYLGTESQVLIPIYLYGKQFGIEIKSILIKRIAIGNVIEVTIGKAGSTGLFEKRVRESYPVGIILSVTQI